MRTKQLSRQRSILALCTSAIFIALSTILSFLQIIEMPMGGSVTLASMLPILFIGLQFGYKWGIGSAFVYSLIQLMQALIKGNVFVYCVGATAVIVCVLFDYVFPFSILGLSAFARAKKENELSIPKALITFSVLIFIRFICHFVTGMTIWGQWDEGLKGAFTYSLLYNGSYMLPELVITVVLAGALLAAKPIRRYISKNS